MSVTVVYPELARNRGPGFWLRWGNVWASRRKLLRADHSKEWRDAFHGTLGPENPDRTVPFSRLLTKPATDGFRFLILGDTGEGDRSQYGLLPLIRALDPGFMIINGDVAYPAGGTDDFLHGFWEPYTGLGIPIWAVPGNHEYYSEFRGREFFEIFCTRALAAEWENRGLRLVPQPGTYWELKEAGTTRLCVIGVDTLMEACLDGDWNHTEDGCQHQWLSGRLEEAQRQDLAVIVLFHIPGLVRQEHDKSTRLRTLHQLVTSYPCVRLVVCGHEHNYQRYAPAQFIRYVGDQLKTAWDPAGRPEYVVSGAGGAFLHSTEFKRADYPAEDPVFPSAAQWRDDYVGRGRSIVDRLGLSRTLLGAVAGRIEEAARQDGDVARYLSLLCVDVTPRGAAVTPYFLDDLENLFDDGTTVSVTDPHPPCSPAGVKACAQAPIVLWETP